ncbi:MAG: hypothetical protein EA389_00535 [Ilumatobacter sp.]|nr:MAG: hypothetical protein EA389_00535 [Ilumatobacter sp.]
MGGDVTDLIVVVVVIGSRLIVPLFIPRFPLPAIFAALVIDAVDKGVFELLTDINLDGYQTYDKALDIYYLTIAYVAVLRNWTNPFAVEVARFLWYYRLVGVVLFELFENRALLFVFSNVFEYFFIAYEIVRLKWNPRRLTRRHVLLLAAFIWIFIKLPQEWWIHIAQLDFTDFVKETVFGSDPADGWLAAFGNRPLVLAALLLAGIVLVAVLLRLRRNLPEEDWTLRFDADAPLPDDVPTGFTGPALRWPVFEKIALLTLVGIIFSQLLQVGASNLQVLTVTAGVVGANVAVSALLARRGHHWRSIGTEFAVLLVLNATLIGVFSGLVSDGRINRAAAWFFGFLFTLIITLYDRYRSQRLARTVLDVPSR